MPSYDKHFMDNSDADSIISGHESISGPNDGHTFDDPEEHEQGQHEFFSGAGTANTGLAGSLSLEQGDSEKQSHGRATVASYDELEDLTRQLRGAEDVRDKKEDEKSPLEELNEHGDPQPRDSQIFPTPQLKGIGAFVGEDSGAEQFPTRPIAETPKRGQHRDLTASKSDSLRIPGPEEESDFPSLDLEQSATTVAEPLFANTIRFPDDYHASLKVARRPRDVLQPGDPDFRRSFAQEQGQNRDQPLKCVLYMHDVFSEFLESEMEDGDHFWDLVVLTGEAPDIWITTCRDYVTEAWPMSVNKIRELFGLLETKISDDVELERRFSSDPTADLIASIYRPSMAPEPQDGLDFTVTLDGVPEPQADIVEAVTWLFSILQQDTLVATPGPYASVAHWKKWRSRRGGASRYKLTLDFLEPLTVSHSEACWTDLVPRTACAVNYGTKERPAEMKGVEISFELLCFLAGLQYEVVEDGGLVLYGKVCPTLKLP